MLALMLKKIENLPKTDLIIDLSILQDNICFGFLVAFF